MVERETEGEEKVEKDDQVSVPTEVGTTKERAGLGEVGELSFRAH